MTLDYSEAQGGTNLDETPVLPGLFEESKTQSSQILEDEGGSAPGPELNPQDAEGDFGGEVLEPDEGEPASKRKRYLLGSIKC